MAQEKRTVKEIAARFATLKPEQIPSMIETCAEDEREGVRKILQTQKKRFDRYQAELERLETISFYEKKYAQYRWICGIDEVGRGPLAGPVVAGAVVLPKDCRILYIDDSKKLSAKKREELSRIIRKEAVAVGIGMASPARIDAINILQATYEAMRDAIADLTVVPDLLLNDAVTIPEVEMAQVPIVHGDAKSISIGAASIVAKVFRDHMMEEYDAVYPGYDFRTNKGYGTAKHIEAIRRLGPCPIHRRSFIGRFIES